MKSIPFIQTTIRFIVVLLFFVSISAVYSYTADDTNSLINYIGDWTSYFRSSCYNQSLSGTDDTDAKVSFYIMGTYIKYYSLKCPYASIVEIWIDDTYMDSIDLFNTTVQYQVLAYENNNLGSGLHKIEIRNTNTRHGASYGYYAHIDYFEFENTPPVPTLPPISIINNDSNKILYSSGWSHRSQTGAGQSGTISLSFQTYATAGLYFVGPSIKLYSKKGPRTSIFEVWIDGVYKASVDMYKSTSEFQVLTYETNNLSNSSHFIEIRNTNTHNPSSLGYYIHIDWIEASVW